jgi:methyl-accepting chemotaxis protein
MEWKSMNNQNDEDNSHYKLRMDKLNNDIDDQAIPAEVNELKLEKISQRVTLISILIPVLIVIILVVAYLDIKKRVVQTEDTGTIEFKKLSSDMDSRFSSLSMRQAKLEDAVEKFTKKNNQTAAAVQVHLQKLNDAIKEVRRRAVSMKELNAAKTEMVKQINSVIDSANQAGDHIAAISKELKSQMDQLNQALAAANVKNNAMDRKIAEFDQNKIDRSQLDLALRLASLKIETRVKSQIQALQNKIGALEDRLTHHPAHSVPAPSSRSNMKRTGREPAQKTPNASVPPSKPDSSTMPKIEEQTIGK